MLPAHTTGIDAQYSSRLNSPARRSRQLQDSRTPTPGSAQRLGQSPSSNRSTPGKSPSSRLTPIRGGDGHARAVSDTAAIFNEFKAASPSRHEIYSDRFIPSRLGSNFENALAAEDVPSKRTRRPSFPGADSSGGGGGNGSDDAKDDSPRTPRHLILLRNELLSGGAGPVATVAAGSSSPRSYALAPSDPGAGPGAQTLTSTIPGSMAGAPPSPITPGAGPGGTTTSPEGTRRSGTLQGVSPSRPLSERTFRFQSPKRPTPSSSLSATGNSAAFSLSPVGGLDTQPLLLAQRTPRKIAKHPYKVLDAPSLKDDFYLNLVDWSSQNVIAVGLGSAVYLWSACTSKVTKLCDLAEGQPSSQESVASVSWSLRGTHLALGTKSGTLQIWDSIKCKKVRELKGHSARVGVVAWSTQLVASGSRDRAVLLRDLRSGRDYEEKLAHHKQEVCGLRWSPEESLLASGGNDNKLLIWSAHHSPQPVMRFEEHTAAVKAIAWSPHQHGVLASGGGTADRCIRFWSTVSGSRLNCIDTGSQVCNLLWSQNVNEIVSTHGYSLNQIIVWKYPSMTKLATLTGHTYRVLFLAASPDGQTIVTGAGDETLRFWSVFPKLKASSRLGSTSLSSLVQEIR